MRSTETLLLHPDKAAVDDTLRTLHRLIVTTPPKNTGLFSGRIGQIMYHFYLADYYRDESLADRGVALLEEVLASIDDKNYAYPGRYALSSGLAGLGFVLTLLREEDLLDIDFEDNLRLFDQYVGAQATGELGRSNTDYLHGGAGSLLYLTTRFPHNAALAEPITGLVEELRALAVEDEKGIRFPNAFIAENNGSDNTNLGLAHGQCGILMVLLKAYQAGIARPLIEEIVTKSIRYILGLRIPTDFATGRFSHFPLTFDDTRPADAQYDQYNARMGWCYGDLNATLLLYTAGTLFNRPDWIAVADEVGLSTLARRTPAETLVRDGLFCHGAVGLAQYYRRLFEMSGREAYLEGYQYWIDQTLEYAQKVTSDEAFLPWAGQLLSGGAGVSLGLISALSERNPRWDRIFLLS